MKKLIGLLTFVLLLSCINAFAADGDLYVNGNVGIGTTTPGYKLDVQGAIHSTGPVVFSDGTSATTKPRCMPYLYDSINPCPAGWTYTGGQWYTTSFWGYRSDLSYSSGSSGWMSMCCQ